jgi:chromate reductase
MHLNTLHLVGFSGSLREQSYNQAALRVLQEDLPSNIELEILPLDTLPFFNQDLEADEPISIRHFKNKIRQADAVVIATPEYNGSISGVLHNALDWASRPHGHAPLTGKLTAVISTGGGRGGLQAQKHVREILHHINANPLAEPTVAIARGWEKFDADGRLVDDITRQQLHNLLQTLAITSRGEGYALAS